MEQAADHVKYVTFKILVDIKRNFCGYSISLLPRRFLARQAIFSKVGSKRGAEAPTEKVRRWEALSA